MTNNDVVTMLLMGFSLKSQQKCDIQQHFLFCCIWVTCWRCVVYPQHVTADLAYFYFCNIFKWTDSNNKTTTTNVFSHSLVRTCEDLWGLVRTCEDSWGLMRTCDDLWELLRTSDNSWERGCHKNTVMAAMATDSAVHCSHYFFCNRSFWQLQLHQ